MNKDCEIEAILLGIMKNKLREDEEGFPMHDGAPFYTQNGV